MIRTFLARLVLSAVSVYLAAFLLPGVTVQGLEGAVITALMLGVVNVFVKPVLLILTLPLNILTLGLFTLVVNGMTFAIAAWLIESLQVSGLGSAIAGAFLVSVFNWLLAVGELSRKDDRS